ncbi:MAG: toll/interleukin-1 receptor domain-containing protein [Prosthecobacter sp.]|uniref:toll/interleukin-1 receptor domain-containing protein n=1 Tax=Prosthecobacter sp. TaxID=1965333 RepID=UPI003BAFD3C1
MKYFSSTEPEIINFSRGIIPEDYLFEKRASVFASSVFLAHSSADKEDLPNVIGFLERHGARVYIDKADKDLPQKTSTETGLKLKERISQCSKFIVLVTPNSKNSRWIPWELGIADEKKKLQNVALLPDVGNQINPEWPQQEYLGLYPRIVFGAHKSFANPIWMVFNHHENTGTELGQWLRGES